MNVAIFGEIVTTFPCCTDRKAKLFVEPGKRRWFRHCLSCPKNWTVERRADGSLQWTEARKRGRR